MALYEKVVSSLDVNQPARLTALFPARPDFTSTVGPVNATISGPRHAWDGMGGPWARDLSSAAGLPPAVASQGHPAAAIPEDEVIRQLDAEDLAGCGHLARERQVLCARGRIAGRMRVKQNPG